MAENVFAVFESLANASLAMNRLRKNGSCEADLHLVGHAGDARGLVPVVPPVESAMQPPDSIPVRGVQIPEVGPLVFAGAFEPPLTVDSHWRARIEDQLCQLGASAGKSKDYMEAIGRGSSILCVSCTSNSPAEVNQILVEAQCVPLDRMVIVDPSVPDQVLRFYERAGTTVLKFVLIGPEIIPD